MTSAKTLIPAKQKIIPYPKTVDEIVDDMVDDNTPVVLGVTEKNRLKMLKKNNKLKMILMEQIHTLVPILTTGREAKAVAETLIMIEDSLIADTKVEEGGGLNMLLANYGIIDV